jgi:alkylation response protein AidB-like acyl-CoA dehydrogenase
MAVPDSIDEWIDANWSLDLTLAEWWQRLADAGYAFPHWPTGFGGRGLSAGASFEIQNTLGRHGVIGPPTGNAPNMGVPTLLAHGTVEQKERFVTPVANGQHLWCQLFSEPGAGSDLASLACKAERDGDEFVINGQKVWNSSADISEWGMLVARTNVDAAKHAGITWMMIDMRQPGIEVRPLVQMNGGAEFCEVFLTDARVPVENVIGGIDNGWNVARTTLTYERGSVGKRYPKGMIEMRAGSMSGNLGQRVGDLIEQAKRAANDPNKRFDIMLGAKSMIRLARDLGLSDDPVVRDRVADYYIRNEVYRLTGQRSRDNAKGGKAGPEGSIMKLALAMLAHRSRDLSLSLLGAEGMLVGSDARENGRVQRAGLSAFAPSLGAEPTPLPLAVAGTNEIQRNIIGERFLGLPREPGNDGEVPFRDLKRS